MNKFSKIGFEYLFMFIAFTQLAVPLLSICCVLIVQLIYPFTKPIKDIIDTTISLSLVIGNFLLFLFIVYRLRHHFRYRKFSRHYFVGTYYFMFSSLRYASQCGTILSVICFHFQTSIVMLSLK